MVILGAGFAGLATAIQLSRRVSERDNVDIILVDRNNEHVYSPLLYEVASGGLKACMPRYRLKRGIAVKMNYEGRLIDHPCIQFKQGNVEDIDLKKKKVKLQSGASMDYDYLVCAMGASVNTFGVEGVEEHAFPLKTIDNAIDIHDKLCEFVHHSGDSPDYCVDIMIAGGGPSGVETAAELATAFQGAKKSGGIECTWRVVVVDGSDRILSSLNESVSRRATKRLASLGVEVYSATRVKSVGESWASVVPNDKYDGISPFTKEGLIEADIMIWTAGIGSNPVWKKWDLPVNDRGYVQVSRKLQVKGQKNVFAIGDMAVIEEDQMQQIAPVAMSHAKFAAENIHRLISRRPIKEYRAHTWPYAIPLGGKYAIAHYRSLTFGGMLGYLFRKAVDLKYFLSILSFGHAIRVWYSGGRTYLENDL